MCEQFKWSGPVGFRKAGFSGGFMIFGPVLPRFRPVPLPARPPKHFFLITSDPGPTPTPLWSPGNVRGWAGPVGPHHHEKHQTAPISGSGNHSYARPGESRRDNSFFPRSWGPRSPTLPPPAQHCSGAIKSQQILVTAQKSRIHKILGLT